MQCLIIRIYDENTGIYVPCSFSLITGRSELMYCTDLNKLFLLLDYRWMPPVVTVYFEKGMLNAAQYQFLKTKILGCLFQFKQALFRKRTKINLLEDEISRILRQIDFNTVLDPEQIKNAIEFIKIYTEQNEERWSVFWVYFSCI
ncbi:hypothetical protein MXB_3097 [Myxobolus squamalis]|nr:hypothetical protein MXB_3097 [Myxobolus squamalis]